MFSTIRYLPQKNVIIFIYFIDDTNNHYIKKPLSINLPVLLAAIKVLHCRKYQVLVEIYYYFCPNWTSIILLFLVTFICFMQTKRQNLKGITGEMETNDKKKELQC